MESRGISKVWRTDPLTMTACAKFHGDSSNFCQDSLVYSPWSGAKSWTDQLTDCHSTTHSASIGETCNWLFNNHGASKMQLHHGPIMPPS